MKQVCYSKPNCPFTQGAGESALAQLRSSDGLAEEELKALLEGVKDPLSAWLDGKVLEGLSLMEYNNVHSCSLVVL